MVSLAPGRQSNNLYYEVLVESGELMSKITLLAKLAADPLSHGTQSADLDATRRRRASECTGRARAASGAAENARRNLCSRRREAGARARRHLHVGHLDPVVLPHQLNGNEEGAQVCQHAEGNLGLGGREGAPRALDNALDRLAERNRLAPARGRQPPAGRQSQGPR